MNTFPSPPHLSPMSMPQTEKAKPLKARWMKTFQEDTTTTGTGQDGPEYQPKNGYHPPPQLQPVGGMISNGTSQSESLDLTNGTPRNESLDLTVKSPFDNDPVMPTLAKSPSSPDPPARSPQIGITSSSAQLDVPPSAASSIEMQHKLAQAQAQMNLASGNPQPVMHPMSVKQQMDLIKHAINLEQQSQMIKQAMLLYVAQAELVQEQANSNSADSVASILAANKTLQSLGGSKVPASPPNGIPPSVTRRLESPGVTSVPSPEECQPYPQSYPKPQTVSRPSEGTSIIKVPNVSKTLSLQKQSTEQERYYTCMSHENQADTSQERRQSLSVERPFKVAHEKISCGARHSNTDEVTEVPINSPAAQGNCICSKPTLSTASKVSKDMGIQTDNLPGLIAVNSPGRSSIDQALQLLQSTQPYGICKNWLAKHVTTEGNVNVTSSVEEPTSSPRQDSPLELLQASVAKSKAQAPKLSNDHVNISTNTGKVVIDSSTDVDNDVVTLYQQGDTKIDYTTQRPPDNKCPVCRDVVSGYHYGIYSCESCKGFFKRTVQSKRNERLRCGRGDSCEIDIYSRTHCASCRFNKCLFLGMKLEAIRGDRQRGGRSMYTGSSEYRRCLELQEKEKLKRRRRRPSVKRKLIPPAPVATSTIVRQEPSDDFSSSNLPGCSHPCSLAGGSSQPMPAPSPPPEIRFPMLGELMKAEDELINQGMMDCCKEIFKEKKDDLFTAVCHLMDHQIYTFVKWARTLPLYKDLKTEDQIVLMQRRGLHLMAMTVCFYFINDQNQISLPDGEKVIITDIKEENVVDIVQGLVDTAGRLRQLGLNKYLLVCLKGIMLLNPVAKGLIELKRVQGMQEEMEDLMTDFIASQPQIPDRVTGILLLRLSEIQRLCLLIREEVCVRQSTGRLGRFPLLMELFKDKPSWLY